jgi:4-hydroxy 2-oxovalerate aldolase
MEQHQWGTNLPYMLAGANCIPQKEVMDWVANRIYSFNSIVRALENRKNNTVDNAQFPQFSAEKKFNKVLVIGGGNNAIEHKEATKEFIAQEQDIAIVFATARHAKVYLDIKAPVYYILVGNEGRRLTANVGENKFKGTCVLPPYPRTMGTEVPAYAKKSTVELTSVDFIDQFKDSVTTIALQLAINLTDGDIFVIGYDGYPGNVLSEKEVALTNENKTIFEAYQQTKGQQLKSLTPSLYKDLNVVSVYQYI